MVFVMASETEKAHALLQTFSTASVISSLGLGIFCFVADRLLQFSFIQQNDWLRAFSDNAVHGILGMWSWAIVIGLRKKSDFTEVTLAGFLASVIDVDHFFLAGSLSLKVVCLVPMHNHHHSENVFLHVQEELPVFQSIPITSLVLSVATISLALCLSSLMPVWKIEMGGVLSLLLSARQAQGDVSICLQLLPSHYSSHLLLFLMMQLTAGIGLFSMAALTLPRRPLLHCSTVIPVVALALKFIMHLFRLKDSWCFLPWMLFISWTSHHVRDGIRHGLWICPFGKTPPLPYWLYVAITASLPHLCSFVMYLTGTRELMSIKHGIHIDV